ncbi:MAG: 4Fe-4S cluster-binding domain-containing protein [Sedimentisphaerales bacterium]|nr:4Fe-4S cluster-binding domain-containing protein [Sedimentisphaerales bacterium]
MSKLQDNLYNQHTRRHESKMKLWRYAGLMLTYRCPASCAFCYYNCGPEADGLMPVDTALSAWQSLRKLAGDTASVHLTGGEPFVIYDHLAELMTQAHQQGLGRVDTVETNGYWATDRQQIVERLGYLDSVGLGRLKISWDPFHAEFIDLACIQILVETARQVLGPARVLVRWEKYLQDPVKFDRLNTAQKQTTYCNAAMDDSCRFTGRAASTIGPLCADKSIAILRSRNCSQSFLGAKGVHIDPYGNVFSGLCSGIIIGNINDKPLHQIWEWFDPTATPVVDTLFTSGPAGLLQEAVAGGFEPAQRYASKCHLCTAVREFFFDTGAHRGIIGPGDCYMGQANRLQEAGIVKE